MRYYHYATYWVEKLRNKKEKRKRTPQSDRDTRECEWRAKNTMHAEHLIKGPKVHSNGLQYWGDSKRARRRKQQYQVRGWGWLHKGTVSWIAWEELTVRTVAPASVLPKCSLKSKMTWKLERVNKDIVKAVWLNWDIFSVYIVRNHAERLSLTVYDHPNRSFCKPMFNHFHSTIKIHMLYYC